MKTIEIKGKPYVMVNERILKFRQDYPLGQIQTELISNVDGVCVIKATILDDNKIIATGHAYESEGSTFINKTSYLENCETSAIGRALGILGIGIEESIASAEEVTNAVNNQDKRTLNTKRDRGYRTEIQRIAMKVNGFANFKIKDLTQPQRQLCSDKVIEWAKTNDLGALVGKALQEAMNNAIKAEEDLDNTRS